MGKELWVLGLLAFVLCQLTNAQNKVEISPVSNTSSTPVPVPPLVSNTNISTHNPANSTALPVASNSNTSVPHSNTTSKVPVVSANKTTIQAPLKVVCYYNKQSENRIEALRYNFAYVNSSLCSHAIYSFASIDPVTFTIQNDSIGHDVEKFLALKDKGVVVMLSVGGKNDSSESEKFSKMVNDGALRSRFIESAIRLLRQYKFQGLDINWEYPSCWNGNCKAGRVSDKANFVNLLKQLRSAMQFYHFEFSVAVSPLEEIAEKAYDIKGIARNVDFINLMAFDYNNETYTSTAIHAPFQGAAPNVVSTVDYWKSKGALPRQLVLGIPSFGRTFSLEKPEWNGVKAPSSLGKPTGVAQPGLAAYFEICKGLNYQLREHEGPYAFKDDQWVSFDDIPSVSAKGGYIKNNELGGAMIWSLDTDDFNGNVCEQGKYPLIKAVRNSMGL